MNKFVTAGLGALCLALGIALVFSHLTQSSLHDENLTLRRQLENFTADEPEAKPKAPELDAADDDSASPDAELVRLRGEVANLRREKQELEKLRAENQSLRARAAQAAEAAAAARAQQAQSNVRSVPRESWAFAGYSDPESALQSVFWAGASGNAAALLAGFTPEQMAELQTEDNTNRTEAEVAERVAREISKIKGFQILQNDILSENEAVLTLYLDGLDGSEQTPRMKMQRVGNEWRLAGPYRPNRPAQQPVDAPPAN